MPPSAAVAQLLALASSSLYLLSQLRQPCVFRPPPTTTTRHLAAVVVGGGGGGPLADLGNNNGSTVLRLADRAASAVPDPARHCTPPPHGVFPGDRSVDCARHCWPQDITPGAGGGEEEDGGGGGGGGGGEEEIEGEQEIEGEAGSRDREVCENVGFAPAVEEGRRAATAARAAGPTPAPECLASAEPLRRKGRRTMGKDKEEKEKSHALGAHGRMMTLRVEVAQEDEKGVEEDEKENEELRLVEFFCLLHLLAAFVGLLIDIYEDL